MKQQLVFPFIAATIVLSIFPALADYTIILKTGRQITVQNYREEAGMVKFPGLGGEIGISKEQIYSIQKGSGETRSGLDILRPQLSSPSGTQDKYETNKPEHPSKISRSEKSLNEKVRKEEEYQKRLKELEDNIRDNRDQYSEITRGAAAPEKSNLTESLQGWTKDLTSKLKESQNAPISSYSEKELELKTLREKLANLEGQKYKLIQEMNEKGITPSPAVRTLDTK